MTDSDRTIDPTVGDGEPGLTAADTDHRDCVAGNPVEVLLRAVVAASRVLLDAPDLDIGLLAAVRSLGGLPGIDRVYVFDHSETARGFRLKAEWARPPLHLIAETIVGRFLADEDFPEVLAAHRAGHVFQSRQSERRGASAEINGQLQSRTDLIFPICLDGEYWGAVGFDDCHDARSWDASEVAVLNGVSAVIAAAVRRARSELEKAEAVAREREAAAEQRVAELAKANEVLRRGIDRVTELGRLEGYVASLVMEAADVFAADAAAILLREGEGTTFRPHAVVSDGRLLEADEVAADPFLGCYAEVSARNAGGIFDEIVVGRVISRTLFDDRLAAVWPEAYDWHAVRHGHRAAWQFPLHARGRMIGFFAFANRSEQAPTAVQIEGVTALGQQLVLALELTRLAEEAKSAAVARERNTLAENRAAELARANDALQATIDALSAVERIEQFVPEALRVVATAFGSSNCAYYEHPAGEPIRLRYWYQDGVVLAPPDLLAVEGRYRAVVRELADGFVVSDEYLGDAFRERTRSVVLDHRLGGERPDLHEFCIANGWVQELNVPLVVGDRSDGALVIYRTAEEPPFRPDEVALAETLGKQLAMAMQTSRLAEAVKATAVDHERRAAAERRAAELERTNGALRRSAAVFATAADECEHLTGFLSAAAEVAGAAAVFRRAAGTEFVLRAVFQDDQLLSGDQLATLACGPAVRAASRADCGGVYRDLASGEHRYRRADDPAADWVPEVVEFHRAHGHAAAWEVPFAVGGAVAGYIGLAFRHTTPPTPETAATVAALGTQLFLALETARVTAAARETAVADERARLAGDIHDSLAQSFAGIAMQLEAAEDAAGGGDATAAGTGMRRARELARFGLAEARRSALALRPARALDKGLAAALAALVERSCVADFLDCRFEQAGIPYPLAPEAKLDLFRAAQEAVSNAVRHGRPQVVVVRLAFAPDGLTLAVEDDGRGMPATAHAAAGGGLAAVRERAARLGGELACESAVGRGTRLAVRVPRGRVEA